MGPPSRCCSPGRIGLTTAARSEARPAGSRRRGSFQPQLLLAVVLVASPAFVRRTSPEGLGPAVVLLGTLVVVSGVASLVQSRLTWRGRRTVGWVLVAASCLVLLAVTRLAVPEQPQHALPFAAGVAVSVAPVREAYLRVPVQLAVVAGMAVLLQLSALPLVEVALGVALLAFVAWLSSTLSQSLRRARHSQAVARQAAERRAELLAAVRDLSGRDSTQAARTVVDTLRSLGFPVAAVSLARSGLLVPLAVEGLPVVPAVEIGDGLAGRAVAENRMIIAEDYSSDERLPLSDEELGTAVVVPIRVDGEAVGAVAAARRDVGPLPEADVEVVEVLAVHLGSVLGTERRVDRQRELLERMRVLESMRERLVTEVSEEVRDPLTVVRGIAETLAAHGEDLPADRRQHLLESCEQQTGELRATIDALLDFSRLQASRPLPALGLVRVRDLLDPLVSTAPLEGELETEVRVDAVLTGRAIELVGSLSPVSRVVVTTANGQARVRLEVEAIDSAPRSRLLLGLAERLVVTAGGTWRLHDGGVELLLPLEAAVGEAPPPSAAPEGGA